MNNSTRLPLPFKGLALILALLVQLGSAPVSLQAASYYWDTDNATPGSGGATPSGTWSTGGTTWSTSSTGSLATSAITTSAIDNMFFSAGADATGAYAITLSGTQLARLVTFEDGTATLSSGTLSLGTGGGITVTTGTVTGATISSDLTISGAQTFTVAASRTLTLNTGTFTRNPLATLNVASTGTVTTTMTGLAVGSLVNNIIGPWASFGSGASTQYATINGSNNIVGFTGTSVTAAGVTDTTGVANYEVTAAGTMGTNASVNTLRYTIAAGTLTTATSFTTNGIMNVGSGVLTLSGTITIGSTKELVVNAANNGITISNTIQNNGGGASGLVKLGSGTLTLSANPTYTGATILNGGTLNIASLGATPLSSTSGITFSGASTIDLATANQSTPSMTINPGVTATVRTGVSGSGSLAYTIPSLSGSGTFSADNPGGTGQGKDFVFSDLSNFTGVLQMNLSGASTDFLVSNINDTVANNIRFAGNGGNLGGNSPNRFNYVGSAGLTLTNRAIEYANGAGAGLAINNNGTANSALIINSNLAVTAGGNKTLQLGGTNTGGTSTFAGQINDRTTSGSTAVITLIKADSNTWTLSNNNTFTGSVTVNGGGLVLGGTNTMGAITVQGGGTLTFGNSGIGSSTATITLGSSTSGHGNLTYNGSNDYSIGRQVINGTTLSGTGFIRNNGSGALIFTNATFNALNGGAGNAKTLNLGGNNATSINEIQGVFRNDTNFTQAVTKLEDASIWKLSGLNSYTGATTVNGGTLLIGRDAPVSSAGALGNAASDVSLGVASSNTAARILTDGAFTVGRIVRLSTANATDGGSRALTLGGNSAHNSEFSGNIFLGTTNQTSKGIQLTAATGGQVTFSGVIQNPSGQDAAETTSAAALTAITKVGAGTVILSNTNTYTGATAIQAGVLQAAVSGAGLPTNSILQIRGGVFQSSGTFSRTVGTAAGNVNWSTSSGGFAAKGGTLNLNLNGGTASVTWNGSSMVQTGQSLIFGSTSADSLVDFQNDLNLGSSSSGQRTITVNDNAGSTTDIARISGAITNTAAGWGILKDGAGTLELTNTNTYSGATSVSSGTLAVTGSGTTGTGAVTAQNNSTILGTGTIRGSTFTAESGSTIHGGTSSAPGDYGTLIFTPASGSGSSDFKSGSNVILDINTITPSAGDLLSFDGLSAGTLLFNGNLQVRPLTGYVPGSDVTFNLLDWANLTPSFDNRYLASTYTGGLILGNGDDNLGFDLPDISGSLYGWDISQFIVDGTIRTALVPEPSRALLLMLGLVGLITCRRRK